MARKKIDVQVTEQPEQELVVERIDQKIDVEIRDIIRIRPQDFSALKGSFEEWAKQWD